MKSVFLFQRRPEAKWSRGRRAGFWAWNAGLVLLSALGVGLVSLLLAPGPYALSLILGYVERPVILLLNVAPVMALALLLYGLTGRAWVSFLITAALTLGFSAGNYFKLMFRDDPLMFGDLFLLREAGNMAGKYQLFVDWKLAVALGCVLAGTVFLFLLVRGRPALPGRLVCALAGAAALGFLVPKLLDASIYGNAAANYERLSSRWSSTQQYIAHGFVYPFVHSVNDAFESPPANYDQDQIAEQLAGYEDGDIPEGQKVNIVAIMLEAYNDFTQFGAPELAQDVYAVWRQLEDEGYSGNLVTNIFAGGTVDTERCFLTGYSKLTDFRRPTNSWVWYLRSQGYTTQGMHPSHQWFYNRANVNENLGFERYLFLENHFEPFADGGNAAWDDALFSELLADYQAGTAGGKPYFNFTVTYQGHGPYDDTSCWWGDRGDFVVDDGTYTDQEQYILDNYFGSIANTNQNLKLLTDYFRADSEPVVLILFGDHNPWMGDGNSVYDAMGISFDAVTTQGFLNYYATRYIVWANDAAKQALGDVFHGEGPDIGPYFLMNHIFDLCGWDGPAYYQAIREVAAGTPVVHATGCFLENGELVGIPEEEHRVLVRNYRCLQYYWRNHFAYG